MVKEKRKVKKDTRKHSKGRKAIFSTGFKPAQHYAALLLALGKRQMDVANLVKVSYETIRYWQQYDKFSELIDDYRKQFVQKIKDEGFDDLEFLTTTMVESLKSPAHRADGLRARELLAKIRGEFSPEEMNLRIQKELEKISDSDLEKLAQEASILNEDNIIGLNTTGTAAEERKEGVGKV